LLLLAYVIAVVMALGVVGIPLAVLASDVSGAEFYGLIDITNANLSAVNVSVNVTIETQEMIDASFVYHNLSNCAIQTGAAADATYMPAPGSGNAWMLFVPSIGSNASTTNTLYTGGGAMSSKIRYFPGANGMTTTDNASLELGDNFSIVQKGFVDTSSGSNKRFAYKEDAFEWSIGATQNVTADIPDDWTTPTGASGSGWSNTAQAWNDNTGDYATSPMLAATPGAWTAYLNLTHASVPCKTMRYYVSKTAHVDLIDLDAYYSGAWQDVYEGGVTQNQWVEHALGDYYEVTQARVRFRNDGNGYANQYGYVYEVDFGRTVRVTATSTSGEHTIEVRADGTNFKLLIDGAEESSVALIGATVPDNANNWTFLANDVMPYMESHNISVSGVLRQEIEWENNATTFTDQSGWGHDAAPTFRTTSSDSDVSASLRNFQPVSPSEIGSYSLTGAEDLWDDAPTAIPELYTELNTNHLPGAAIINDALDAAGVDQAAFWFPACFGVAIALGLVVYGISDTLFMQCVASAAVMIYCSLMTGGGIIPYWTTLIFVFEALVLMWTQRQRPVP